MIINETVENVNGKAKNNSISPEPKVSLKLTPNLNFEYKKTTKSNIVTKTKFIKTDIKNSSFNVLK